MGIHRQPCPAGLMTPFRFQACDTGGNCPGPGSAACIRASRPFAPGAARRCAGAWRSNTDDQRAGAEIGAICSRHPYPSRGGRTPAGLPVCSAEDCDGYFQKYGEPVLDRPSPPFAAKNHKNAVENPGRQMRKDLGFVFCRTESQNPFVCRPAQTHRLARWFRWAAAAIVPRRCFFFLSRLRCRHRAAMSCSGAAEHAAGTFLPMSSATFLSSKAARWDEAGFRQFQNLARMISSFCSKP